MDALVCVRREIRRLQEQQRRARRVQARLGLTRTKRLVAVGCYTPSNYNLPLAITFVEQRASTSWLPSTDTELGEVLENWFLETSEATIVAFEHPETRVQKLLRSRVETFLAECATVNFIKTCNFTNSYAPSSSEVASQFVETLRGREELTTHQGLEHASRWQRCSRPGLKRLQLLALEELAKALGPLRLADSKQIVIVWDCCRVHLTEEVCDALTSWTALAGYTDALEAGLSSELSLSVFGWHVRDSCGDTSFFLLPYCCDRDNDDDGDGEDDGDGARDGDCDDSDTGDKVDIFVLDDDGYQDDFDDDDDDGGDAAADDDDGDDVVDGDDNGDDGDDDDDIGAAVAVDDLDELLNMAMVISHEDN
eukprot:s3198_g2.t1